VETYCATQQGMETETCIVLFQKTFTPPSLGSYYPLKILAISPPPSSEFSVTLCEGCKDIFWNHTFHLLSCGLVDKNNYASINSQHMNKHKGVHAHGEYKHKVKHATMADQYWSTSNNSSMMDTIFLC